MMILRSTTCLVAALLLCACGGDAVPSKQERTRTALERLFRATREGDVASAAARIVYRGKDTSRKWKTVYDAANEEERSLVEGAMAEIRKKLGSGKVAFLEFRAEAESEGEWLAWRVKTDEGTYWFACLDISGQIALGDID